MMRFQAGLRLLIPALVLPLFSACSSNTMYFYEHALFGISTEVQENGMPRELQAGYMRKIVSVVPPKNPAKKNCSKKDSNENPEQCLHEGEALSSISFFSVRHDWTKITVDNNFASGRAAAIMARPVETNAKSLTQVESEKDSRAQAIRDLLTPHP